MTPFQKTTFSTPPNNHGESPDDCRAEAVAASQKKSLHPIFVPVAVSPRHRIRPKVGSIRNGGRRASFDRNTFRSSLQTIESSAVGSLDIYDDDDDMTLRSSQMSHVSGCSSIHRTVKRRHSLELNVSSSLSLMVSFSRLSEQELTHLRKWNRRLQRTEVFDKYYFPAQWEANEMEALVGFLKLEDPSMKIGVGIRGGSMRGSGKAKENGTGRRVGSRQSRQMSGSWQGPDTASPSTNGGLSSSFTSLKDSAGKLSKLLVSRHMCFPAVRYLYSYSMEIEHGLFSYLTFLFIFALCFKTDPKPSVDPVKVTKLALDFLFFPFVHDPKSVLLKRGSVFLHDASLSNERELMIFTHGFLIANVVLEDAFRLFLALSDREFLTAKTFLDYLQNKFREMDEDSSGEIDKWELQKLFTDMGVPMGESVLDELIQRSLISTIPHGQAEKVDWEALYQALKGFFIQNNGDDVKGSLDNSGTDRDAGKGLKKILGAFQKRKTSKVEFASLFSDVARVDSLNICHGNDAISREIANSAYAHTSFSVTLNEREKDPLIFVCSKPEHRDSWVEGFKPGVVRALTKSSRSSVSELRNKLGWQHLVIRTSFYSLVVMNDVEALECAIHEDCGEEGNINRKNKLELNLLDEYNGYSPLHYATILGHTECMTILLESGSKVTVEDREGQSPMYHGKFGCAIQCTTSKRSTGLSSDHNFFAFHIIKALSLRNDEVANVLENFGADRTDDLSRVIARDIERLEAEELKKSSLVQTNGGLETHVENNALDLSCSERSGDIDALLMEAVAKFPMK
ncbi:hypothetical protein ACHAXR_007003 [Thalassiosira sp. AJA248-18]